jgi:glycosyltransferase involved in cell wall biosynthesis
MRYLFVNQYYSPDFAATAQLMADLCEHLAREGNEVHVLTGDGIYDGREIRLPSEEMINGVHVHRVSLSTHSRQRIRDRLQGYASFYMRAFIRAQRIPRPDVIVTLTTPPMISLLGTWTRFFRRSKFVYWVMDIYPDIATRAGVLKKFGPISGIWSFLGRMSYWSANRVVVLGSDMKHSLVGKGVPEKNVEVIQTWACSDQVRPVAEVENDFRRAHLRKGRFTVMYSGNMGTCHVFDPVVKGIHQLEADHPFDFLFVGAGKKCEELKSGLQKYETSETVRFLPYQERENLSHSLSAPDVHLITLDPKFDGLLVPSKVYGVMAAARPIIFVGSAHNEVAQILRDARCGIRVGANDPEGFVESIRELAANPEKTRQMGLNGRAYFEKWFDRERACARFGRLFQEVVKERGRRGAHPRAMAASMRLSPGRSPLAEQDSSPRSLD